MRIRSLWRNIMGIVLVAVMVVGLQLPTTAFAEQSVGVQSADDYIYVPESGNETAAGANANTYPGCSAFGSNSWKNNFTEFLYLQSEVGSEARTITSLSWYTMNSAARTETPKSFKVYMGLTSQTSIAQSSLVDANDMTLVYSGTPTIEISDTSGGQWMEVDLNTAYEYPGTSGNNLVIAIVSQSDTSPGLINTANQSNSGKGFVAWDDNNADYFADYSAAVTNVASMNEKNDAKNRPSIRLGYSEGNGSQEPVQETGSITLDPATFSLTAGGEAATSAITYNGDGALSASSDKESVATASISGKTLSITPVGEGSAIITVSAAETEGYTAASATLNVEVQAAQEPEPSDPSGWDGATAKEWTKGSGTAEDPYLIESAENLAYLRDQVNGGQAANSTNLGMYSGVYFKQTADINLGNITWIPIGVYTTSATARAFSGHYDGGGHTISGLKVSMAASSSGYGVGFFANVKGNASARASIANLVLEGSVEQTSSSYSSGYTGGLAGYTAYTDIRNCGNNASVTSARNSVAGITGNAYYSTVDGCFNKGNITQTYAGSYAAGIAAQAANNSSFNTSITNCYNTGNVTSPYYAGGIVSMMYCGSTSAAHTLENCYNTGTITATDESTHVRQAGGIVGYISTGGANYASAQKMTNCFTLVDSAPKALIGVGEDTYMTITNSDERPDSYMKSAALVSDLGEKFIMGADYPTLFWEAPDGIPEITEQPADAAYVKDQTPQALTISASGDAANGALVYQWYKASKADLSDAAAISGAASASYTPATDAIGDTYYYCIVNNNVQTLDGSGPYLVQSKTAHIQVWSGANAVAPQITTQPVGIASVGQASTSGNELSVAAAFAGADETDENCELSYQWQMSDTENGEFADIDEATNATYAASTSTLGTKYYRCVVTNTREGQSTASVTSEVASVTVEGYTIDSYAKLKEFAAIVDGGDDFEGRSVTLTADITVESDYDPAGDYNTNTYSYPAHYFKGEFDGAGHTVTFDDVNTSTQYFGIIGAANSGASIHDLIVKGSINSSSTNVAGVVGYTNGAITLERVGNEADITSTGAANGMSPCNVAGLVGSGYTTATVTLADCYNKGDITGNGSRIGGLVGYAKVEMTSCYNTGAVTSKGTYTSTTYPNYIGGLQSGLGNTIKNSYNVGTVSAPNAATGHVQTGSVTGYTSATDPSDNDVVYWLDTSCGRARAGTSAQPAGFISKTAEVFADETGETGVLALLKAGDYAAKWQVGSELAAGVQASPALYWEAKKETAKYTITYELGGGTNAEENPASYTSETDTITLAAPQKDGCHFLGWYSDADFAGDAVTEIAKGSVGAVTLYAKWEDHVPGDAVIENEAAAGYNTDAAYEEVIYCTVCKAEISRKQQTVENTSLKAVAEAKVQEASEAYDKATKEKDGNEAYEQAQTAVTKAAAALNAAKAAQSAANDEQQEEAAGLVNQARTVFDDASDFLDQMEKELIRQDMLDVLNAAIASLAKLDKLVDESTYTAATWKEYDEAYTAFKELAKDSDGATASDVRAARSAVTKAFTKLEAKAAQNLTVSTGTSKVGYAALAKAEKTYNLVKASGNVGALSYSKAAGSSAYASVNAKTGAITLKKGTPAGTQTVKVKVSAAATDDYAAADKTVTSTITVTKAKQSMTAKAKVKTVKAAKVKKKKQTVSAITVKNAQGKKTFKKAGGSKKLTVSAKTGKITVKKGTRKGTYKVKVKVTAKGNGNYNAATKTVTVKIKVK